MHADLQTGFNELGLMAIVGAKTWARRGPMLPALLKDVVKVLILL